MPEIEIQTVLNDPSTSTWLRQALENALRRDPVDAARDAELCSIVLQRRADELLAAFADDSKA